MDYLLICFVAFAASALTLFSGFGLGTLLLPAFALFFPIEIAVALTGIVHFLNNLFKLALIGNMANKTILVKFGLPAIVSAFLGAWLLGELQDAEPLFVYGNDPIEVYPIKFIIGGLLIFFALFDIVPSLSRLQFSKKYLSIGGLLSGFFGGLSGNQGALRSAFLIRAGLDKESYIATGVVIACLIDFTRLGVYASNFQKYELNYTLLAAATLCAFAGAFVGNKLIKKITIRSLQLIVAGLLVIVGSMMCAGIL